MTDAYITLKKGGGRTLKAGGAWIYDNEIDSVTGDVADGELVHVHDFDGYYMGIGFINRKSKITVRMMSRVKGTQIDDAFIKMRVKNAIDYRMAVIKEEDRSAFRVIFGGAGWHPGIVIDKYADKLVVQSLALGIDNFKLKIVEFAREILGEYGYNIRGVYERSDAKVRDLEGMPRIKGFIGDEFETKVQIEENGVRYIVDVQDGQKTGFFLDQKYNRASIRPICKGARVLDCFTHTGSFALNAGMAGAREVTGVDASELAVNQAAENARLNGIDDIVKFECRYVFELLPELEKKGEKFDVVILDPPAFTKSRESVKKAVRGYREINLRAMKLVKDGGFLATCSCSHFMEPELFTKTIGEAAHDVHKRLRQVEYRTQCSDHPILWAADESLYLKFYIFQVVEEK